MITIKLLNPILDRDFINHFYETHARSAKVTNSDIVFCIYKNDFVTGMVRLAREENVYVLRSMQIIPQFQREGLGSQLLQALIDKVQSENLLPLYCIPYAHLENFYSQIKLDVIDGNCAPVFLQQRIFEYQNKNPDKSFILMARFK